jgi:ubiquinone/menaquinone biosynthesis C-methylase UbiE
MTDRAADTTADSERIETLVEAATDLVGTEELWSGQILYTGVELGLFEVLDDDPASASELAAEIGLDTERTYRLLRAMASLDVLDEDEHRRFSLTPVGECFRAEHPHSVRSDLLFNRSREWMRAMLHMPDIVREGDPSGFVREFGCDFFDYVQENPEFGDRYDAMIERAARDHPNQVLDALDAYDFSQFSHICDVGGGRGHLLCHLLKTFPHLRGTVLDLPGVVAEDGRRWAAELGVSDRCTYRSGDMFEAVPEADAYVMKWILHNFDDEECRQILANVHDAAPPDGRLFVVETVVPGPETAHFAKRRDVTMLVQVGGRERTRTEYASLFERTGWELVDTWNPETGSVSVLEAAKA